MRKQNWFLWGIFILFTLGYVLYESGRPQPLDWSETFSAREKNPYGTYVLKQSLPYLFPAAQQKTARLPLVEELKQLPPGELITYIFVERNFEINPVEQDKLLNFVAAGNRVFIAALSVEDSLLACLNVSIAYTGNDSSWFMCPAWQEKKYAFRRAAMEFDLEKNFQGRVLGRNSRQQPVFIQVPYGKGTFWLNSDAIAFTNYWMLDSVGRDYSVKALSYLPDEGGTVIWDEYHTIQEERQTNFFQVLLRYPAIRNAFFLLLAGGILYVLFRAKREQRPIPVLYPYENKTLEFVSAVSGLYYRQKNHSAIARKYIGFLLEEIRSRYQLRTDLPDARFIRMLAECAHAAEEEVAKSVRLMAQLQEKEEVGEDELKVLVKSIEKWWKKEKQ